MKVITSVWLTEPEERLVPRSWYERLFTLPWHPLLTQKTITMQVPYRGALQMGDAFVMHPQTLRQMMTELKEE